MIPRRDIWEEGPQGEWFYTFVWPYSYDYYTLRGGYLTPLWVWEVGYEL
jgi:hypothetical protein